VSVHEKAPEVCRKPLIDLLDHERNPRKHPPEGSEKWLTLAKSLRDGVIDLLVWNRRNGKLVSGHFRKKVMLADGWTHAWVIVVDLDEPTHLARMRALNDHSGDWNQDLLKAIAIDLNAAGIDPALAMWNAEDLAQMLEPPVIKDDEGHAQKLLSEADKLQLKWRVKPGDMWQIGPHRLLCADCANSSNWHLLLDGRKADCVWNDPPYNVDYENVQQRRIDLKAANGGGVKAPVQEIENDDMTAEKYAAFLQTTFSAYAAVSKPGAVIYIAHADMWRVTNETAAQKAGWLMKQNIVWVKSGWTLSMQDHHWQHEPVLYGWLPGAAHYWQGGYRRSTVEDLELGVLPRKSKPELIALLTDLLNARDTTVVREPRSQSNDLHPTIKPLHLVARQIWNSTRELETVIDGFLGSGTTMLAAEHIRRRAFGMDVSPKYCSVVLERMKSHGVIGELKANYAQS
jgi:DNA modification methylase